MQPPDPGLRDDYPVERILVMNWQFGALEQRFRIQADFDQTPASHLFTPPRSRGIGQRQLSRALLERDLPQARMAHMQR